MGGGIGGLVIGVKGLERNCELELRIGDWRKLEEKRDKPSLSVTCTSGTQPLISYASASAAYLLSLPPFCTPFFAYSCSCSFFPLLCSYLLSSLA